MEREVYVELESIQDSHWWFIAKREIIMYLIEKYKLLLLNDAKENLTLCDMGCGMGVLLNALSECGNVFGMDCELTAIEYCSKLWGERQILYGKLPDEIPFAPGSFDIMVLSDCLEHIDKDLSALIQTRKLLKNEKSFMVITVPALMCLWGYNDTVVHHRRRYTKKQLVKLVEQSGLHVEMCSYYNFWLFPIIWVVRKVKNILKIKKDDLSENIRSLWINKMLYRIFASEKACISKKGFPIGVSLIMIASKGDE